MHKHQWGSQPEMFGPRHEYRLSLFTRETQKLPRGSSILDAAVGLGQLASKLAAQGHKPFGLDSSIEAATHVRSLGIPVVLGDMTRLPFRSGVFTAMTSGETLEHLDDDVTAATEIHRVLQPDGRCIVTVPALQILWNKSDDYYEHRRRYSRKQLTRLFNPFASVRAKYWGFPLVLLYDTIFLLPMNLRRSRKDPAADAPLRGLARAARSRLLVNSVKALFNLDRLFSFIPFGPGLLLVAQKR